MAKHEGQPSVGGSGNPYDPKHDGGRDGYEWAKTTQPKPEDKPDDKPKGK